MHNKCISLEPKMFDLVKIVIPKIMNEWEYIAYAFHYDIATIEAIKICGYDDPKTCSKEFFKDWLTTDHGAKVDPKVWSTLLDTLKEIDDIPYYIIEDIVTKIKQLKCDFSYKGE